MSAAKLNID